MSKLLLVEDDNNLREIYEARLQAEGYTIVTAKDGEEALAVAKSEKPDLIVSDVMMPKISGFEMLDILKNTDGLKNVKVIMLTALGQSDDQQRADTLGADRYLVKSQVTLEDIVRVAHELLEDGGATPADSSTPAATPDPAPVAPAPTPTAVTPAPEPVDPPSEPVVAATPAVTPTPVATPVPDPAAATPPPDPAPVASNTSADEAMSASEESANLDDQIQDIIEGASTEAPAPTDSSTPDPAPVAPAPPAPVAPTNTTTASIAATDEKLMNEAVNSLTNESVAPTSPAPAATPVAPAIEPEVTSEDKPQEAATPNSSASTMSHEKVITPPANSQVGKKPDIQALFAAEQAKEASTGDTVQPQPSTPPSPDKPIDPNSIAL